MIDGLRAHGAPNHCGSVAAPNTTVRNAVLYNCQDYFYLYQTDNVLIEHTVNPSGIALQGISGPVGKVTVRNSILSGSFGYTTASKACLLRMGERQPAREQRYFHVGHN